MATAQREQNILYGILDEHTAEQVTFRKTTTAFDGQVMDDSHLLPGLLEKVGSEYFQRVINGRLNVEWFGIKGDGTTYHQETLNKVIQATRKLGATLYFPQGTYRFKALLKNNTVLSFPIAIDLPDANLTLEGEQGTVFLFDPACVGMQITRVRETTVTKIKNIVLAATGKDPLDGKVNGQWGQNWGLDYRHNGINCFNQVVFENVDINGFSGHGICVYGDPLNRIGYKAMQVVGTIGQPYNDKFYFIPNNPNFLLTIPSEGNSVSLGSFTTTISGRDQQGFVLDQKYSSSLPTGTTLTATFTTQGAGLIADNVQMYGVNNLQFNGGCGLFLVGQDGNQGSFLGLTVRGNGGWGIFDQSFLGTHFFGTHGTNNGVNFNDEGFQYYPLDLEKMTIGAFNTADPNARSTWVGCYSEEGNQGPSYFGPKTTVTGGIHAAGNTGPGFWQEGSYINRIQTSQIRLEGGELIFTPYEARELRLPGTIELRTGNNLWFVTNDIPSSVAVGQVVYIGGDSWSVLEIVGNSFRYGTPREYGRTSGSSTARVQVPNPYVPVGQLRFRELANGTWGFGYGGYTVGSDEQNRLSFMEAGRPLGRRLTSLSGIQSSSIYVGDSLLTAAASVSEFLASLPANTQVLHGDQLRNSNISPSSPVVAWDCVESGTTGSLPTGITASNNGPTLRFTQPIAALHPGCTIRVGSSVFTVTSKLDNSNVYVTPVPGAISGASVSYNPPKFRPTGCGMGTTAQRPDLTGLVGPWDYLNTETNQRQTWTGSSWQVF